MTKLLVEVYARKDCKRCCQFAKSSDCVLCQDVKDVVDRVMGEIPFQFKEIDVCSSEDLDRRYREDVPTIFINGKKAFKFKIDEAEFKRRLRKEMIKDGMQRLWEKKHHYG